MWTQRVCCGVVVLLLLTGLSIAQEGETWETQERVWDVTTIKIYPNAGEDYLNSLKRTWASAMSKAKKDGLISDYRILSSVIDNGGDYNLMLIIEHPNLAALDANSGNRAKWKKFEKEMEAIISEEEVKNISGTVYPKIREITGQTLLREIRFLP
jgi:hypothetical protein